MLDASTKQILKNALAQHRAGRVDEAEKLYHQVLVVDEGNSDALHMLGVLTGQRGQIDAAIQLIRRAIATTPMLAEAHGNLGNFMKIKGDLKEAEKEYRLAIEFKPLLADAHSNLGVTLRAQGRVEEAITSYREAISIRPDYVDAYFNLANAHGARMQPREAIANYERVIQFRPEHADAHLFMAYHLLGLGEFKRGWEEYEWRWGARHLFQRRAYKQPEWKGENLNGKSILLYTEQGLGDAIQFVRYVSNVAQRGGRIIIECQAELQRLFASIPAIERAVTRGQPVGDFDFHGPLMSLPGIVGTELDSIPNRVPYLQADAHDVARWEKRFDTGDASKKVGLVWTGAKRNITNLSRSIPPKELLPLVQSGMKLISLQKGQDMELNAPVELKLIDWTSDIADFADTAALIANLDLVISIDTAAAHLAGAMGKEVWLLIPFDNEWRWLKDRDDSPWYPTMRIFRQNNQDDWSDPIAAVVDQLKSL